MALAATMSKQLESLLRDSGLASDLQLRRVEETLRQKEIAIGFSEDAKYWLGKLGYDPTLGARPLKRVIQQRLENPLAQHILKGDFVEDRACAWS